MNVLFIGGTGVISSTCSRLAVESGIRLTLLNRGRTGRPVPSGAEVLHADIRDPGAVRTALQKRTFDAVVDWVCYTPEQAGADVRMFAGRTGQFVFIGTASSYKRPPARLPVAEDAPLSNPVWEYSRLKIECEEVFFKAFRDSRFPVTVVRPSHTYDRTMIPVHGRYTVIDRMRRGEKVVVHGDGNSLWTPTTRISPRDSSLSWEIPKPWAKPSTSPPTKSSPGTRSWKPWPRPRALRPASCTFPPT
jgi:nucleoside-diphosphate-sugar epimerase